MDIKNIKSAHNRALRAARQSLDAALNLRKQIVDLQPQYSGSSTKRLQEALDAANAANSFSLQ